MIYYDDITYLTNNIMFKFSQKDFGAMDLISSDLCVMNIFKKELTQLKVYIISAALELGPSGCQGNFRN